MSKLEYKIGDQVKIKSLDWYNENKDEDGDVFCGEYDFVDLMTKFCSKVVTIENCYEHDCYTIKEDNEGYVFTGEMFEGLVKETSQEDEFNKAYQEMVEEADERFKHHKCPKVSGVCKECVFAVKDNNPHCGLRGFRSDFNVKSCSAKNNITPNGFELQSDGYFSWVNRKEYPKTYEDCSLINGAEGRISLSIIGKFTKLINARNAYWRIIGQEMGLEKPWKPDWTNQESLKYCIAGVEGQIKTAERYIVNTILAFPTAEMRNAFYENFKDLIEECKEFL